VSKKKLGKPIVSYKDETGVRGQVYVFHDPTIFGQGWPLGQRPASVENCGWMTRGAARDLAKVMGAEFKEDGWC